MGIVHQLRDLKNIIKEIKMKEKWEYKIGIIMKICKND